MAYPFPGMNPWLETSRLWSDVHLSLISLLRETLAPVLEPRYFVGVGTHTYISTIPTEPIRSRYPDLSVLHRGGPTITATAVMAPATPVMVDLPLPEPYEEPYLEVRLVPDSEVVTMIEVLSHTNKRMGDERKSYLQKRKEFINSDVHFVEIDLLRAYQPMPYMERFTEDYRIFIRRREQPLRASIYAFSVRQTIPAFPLPLLPDDQEPLIDLGALLQTVYDRARYKLVIDYTKAPEPRLSAEDALWAAQCLNLG